MRLIATREDWREALGWLKRRIFERTERWTKVDGWPVETSNTGEARMIPEYEIGDGLWTDPTLILDGLDDSYDPAYDYDGLMKMLDILELEALHV